MQNMNRIVVPTGYMSSGSSAITDLVSEMDGFIAKQGTFEYVFLHCPNGVFDLEDKLLVGNNAVRSDEALHSFLHTMKQLYDKKYWWVGHYKEYVGEKFWADTEEYVRSLTQYTPDYYWYYQENCNAAMICRLVIRKLVGLITFGKVRLKKPLLYDDMLLSFVSPEEFYTRTKTYLGKIWDASGLSEQNIILDQLLLPFNLHRISNYFDDSIEVFVVERDPRDIFLENKYIYPQRNEMVPFPTEARAFAECYRRLRKMEKPAESDHIHRVRFEDLIYRYDETSKRICEILQVPESGHTRRRTKFIPEKSIRNTQLFFRRPELQAEVQPIEELLAEYLYPFPYEYQYDGGETF